MDFSGTLIINLVSLTRSKSLLEICLEETKTDEDRAPLNIISNLDWRFIKAIQTPEGA